MIYVRGQASSLKERLAAAVVAGSILGGAGAAIHFGGKLAESVGNNIADSRIKIMEIEPK